MSYEKDITSDPPPVYPNPAPYPLKDETPSYYYNQTPTAPAPPPPAPVPSTPAPATTGQQYHEQLLAPCAAGRHDPTTKFGSCGIITAICCFPIGLLCLCADRETRCARCGVLMSP